LLFALLALGVATATPAQAKPAKPKPNPFANTCNPVSTDPAVPSFHEGDAWRSSSAYKFPFYGWTARGMNTVIWQQITKQTIRKAPYPSPNLPSCRVGRFGTEDRSSRKNGPFIGMLEPINGSQTYEFRDTYDRHVATLQWLEDPPVKYHPSKWGWFIDDKWAGHDATRAFEVQGRACKLTAQTTTEVVDGATVTVNKWVRDPNFIMVSFNPTLGSPGNGATPRSSTTLRVRAFIDRAAIPPALLANADAHDFGCGSTALPQWQAPHTLNEFNFPSSYGPNKAYLRNYYFGESPTKVNLLPGESPQDNLIPYSNYTPRPWYNHATYAMINSTAVSGGGMVRGIVRSTVDTLALYDEMRYCDPNYTLRNMQLVRNKKHYKKSAYFAPATFSAQNRPGMRWVYGRIDPNPSTLTPEQALATQNPLSVKLFAWMPIYCDR
jgi:hypothetical protein